MLLLFKNLYSPLRMSFDKILWSFDKREIGQWLVYSNFDCLLLVGMTLAVFKWAGTAC